MKNEAELVLPQAQEVILKGIPASPGISVGPAYVYAKHTPQIKIKELSRDEIVPEIERLNNALSRAENELQKILSFTEQKLGSDNAKIFEAQIMILRDEVLLGAITHRIRKELRNSEFIVTDEIGKYKRMMLSSNEEYMHERAKDVEDVMNRIIRNIQDQKLFSRLDGETIIIAESLTPADTVIFSRNKILGYATDFGGNGSHAALLSRSLKIPAVVGLRTATKIVRTGDIVAIDGYGGLMAINPGPDTIQSLKRKQQRYRDFEQNLTSISGLAAETPDHRQIELSANIEFETEIPFALEQGAAGIGLYRTESQLMGRSTFPTEDEQYEEYRKVADAVYPHPVIFRTFDIGGDKVSPEGPREDNPFLGWRGIRISLDRPEVFLTQMRAILRASARKNVRVMFPMVSSVLEIRTAKKLIDSAKTDLLDRNIPFDPKLQIGVMIEVPAAAILAEEIAEESDFLSIGTNDLIQYMLAVDRGNSAVSNLYQEFNPAVLRVIRSVITAAHKRNKWVGMCGEMAGDPLATVLLIGMGLDEFSVIPPVLPEIKKIIRSVKYRDAKRVTEKVLGMLTEDEIKTHLTAFVKKTLPDIPLDE